jgi:uncharacterized membrane protein YdjX (TVP38/TMEM64 family)
MHAEIETEATELTIRGEGCEKPPMNFYEFLNRIDFLRYAYALGILVLVCIIVISLVINPKSLNSDSNSMINTVLGVILTVFVHVSNNLFKEKK